MGTSCPLILSVGMANTRFLFLGSFAALALSQQTSVLCILPHVSHLGFGASGWFESLVLVFVA